MMYTRDQVVEMLRKKQGTRLVSKFAADIGVTEAYVYDIYRNRRDPGPAILSVLGMEKVVMPPQYRIISKAAQKRG